MFEQNNDFTKGLNLDLSPIKQPENTYREAINFVRLSDTGDYYSLTNEKGTLEYCDLPDTYSVIGRIVLESDMILISVKNDLSASQIGIVDSNSIYTVKLNDINNELKLDLDYPISMEARTLINSNRVIYFTDNKNIPRTIDLDNPPSLGKIDKLSSLVPVSDFPIIDNFIVNDSITVLTCGAYQFVFRYLDDKGNITNVSIPSTLVSIGQNSVSSGDQYQGGYDDILASKSITLNISNVDTDYKKLEIIAINYTTDANTIIINSAVQLDIATSTITYEYKGDILYPLTIDEVLGTTTNYSTAKAITQKDGRLIISNLKENSSIEASLQNIANQIVLKYNIDTEPVNAYKDGNNTAYKVGYKRGEIYAFGFGVIYKNGAKSLVYHIPAPDTSGTPTDANTTTKVLGTYISNINYPIGQGYPTGFIRYHKMPTYQQEPPYGFISGLFPNLQSNVDTSNISNQIVNILNIVPVFSDLGDWNDIKDQVQGIYIVRRRRDSTGNTSIFSQGITNYIMDNFTINIQGDEKEVPSGSTNINGIADFRFYKNNNKVLKKTPFLGGIRLGDYIPYYTNNGHDIIWDGEGDNADALQTTNQPLQQTYIADPTNILYTNQTSKNGLPTNFNNTGGVENTVQGELYKDLLVFYSPETQLLPKIEANTFTKIRRVGQATFSDNIIRSDRSTYEGDDTDNKGTHLEKYPMWYNAFSMKSIDTSKYNETNTIDISKNYYVPRNSITTTDYDGLNIDNTMQEEFLFLQTKTPNIFANDEFTFKYFASRNVPNSDNDVTSTQDQIKNIYEVISNNTAQYGSVQGQEYVICKYIPYNQDTLPLLSTYNNVNIYGGDTYITRMSFTNKTPIQSKYYYVSTLDPNRWKYPTQSQDNSFGTSYIDIRSNIEFYVESSKNTDLRHSLDGGNEYYRYTSIDNSLITNPAVIDDVKSYNNQYDFENDLQLFESKSDISSTTNNHYKTRTIWSDQTVLGELRDRYRDIHPNDFYDLPFNTGEIWNNFVFSNTLYLHTPKTLWKTFFNAIEQQASTAGQVTLGTGGVFPINLPPQQIITQQGGYGGTISQWAGCNTPFGYIFPDSLQGKLFLLGESGLEEISMNGIIRYTNDNLSILDNLYIGYIDNPFKSNSSGLLSVYDFELKRWILVKQHPTNKLTLSFDPMTKQFTSNHDYSPNVLLSRDNRLFGIMNSEEDIKLYEHNKGDYGNFYNIIYPSSISIIINTGNTSENGKSYSSDNFSQKVFDNIILSANSEFSNKLQSYRTIGDTLEVYNERQHTGVNSIIWTNIYGFIPTRSQIKAQLLRNGYNFKIPLDSLISDSNPIFDNDNNLITSNIDQNRLYRDRIKGYYCVIKYTFSNNSNYKLTLNEIKTMFRNYNR